MDKFFALSDPTRRGILELLSARGSLSVTEILLNFDISQPAVSQHLKILRDAHLVESQKFAQQRLYSLNYQGLSEIDSWIQNTTKQWNTRFDALEKVLQKEQERST